MFILCPSGLGFSSASLVYCLWACCGDGNRTSKHYMSNGSSRTEKDIAKKAENEYTNNSKREMGTDLETLQLKMCGQAQEERYRLVAEEQKGSCHQKTYSVHAGVSHVVHRRSRALGMRQGCIRVDNQFSPSLAKEVANVVNKKELQKVKLIKPFRTTAGLKDGLKFHHAFRLKKQYCLH